MLVKMLVALNRHWQDGGFCECGCRDEAIQLNLNAKSSFLKLDESK